MCVNQQTHVQTSMYKAHVQTSMYKTHVQTSMYKTHVQTSMYKTYLLSHTAFLFKFSLEKLCCLNK